MISPYTKVHGSAVKKNSEQLYILSMVRRPQNFVFFNYAPQICVILINRVQGTRSVRRKKQCPGASRRGPFTIGIARYLSTSPPLLVFYAAHLINSEVYLRCGDILG